MFITILIADDHALLRQGIKNALELEPDFRIIGEAGDGEETIEKVNKLKPDVLLLDINMPRLNGLEVARQLGDSSHTKIVVLTIHDDDSYVVEVIRSGAAGYLLKDVEPRMLVQAIRCVHGGDSFIYPTLAKRLFNQMRGQEIKRTEAMKIADLPSEERLTGREKEVLYYTCQGLSNLAIAQKLFLSEKTVKNHLTNIFRKINVTDRTQAVLYALKHKIVQLPGD